MTIINRIMKSIGIVTFCILLLSAITFIAFNKSRAEDKNKEIYLSEADILTGNQAFQSDEKLQQVSKDETVYVNLNYDGTISKINIVNYFQAHEPGIYYDYGNYSRILNLTNPIEPIITEDLIKWVLEEPVEAFYYQGSLETEELPWLFQIKYLLNGEEIAADALAGTEGELILKIEIKDNTTANEYFQENYMLQVMIPLNMEKSTLLSAPGSIQMITGRTRTLAYTILPKTSQIIEIHAKIKDFSMEPIDITIMKAELSEYIQTDEINEGFTKMSDGMEELSEGTLLFSDGMRELSDGITKLSNGLGDIIRHTPELTKGMEEYEEGLKQLRTQMSELAAGSKELKEGLAQLHGNGNRLSQGYHELEKGIGDMLAMKQEIAPIALEMTLSLDPAVAGLAQAILGYLEGLTQLEAGIKDLNIGLEEYAQGVGKISEQYGEMHSGIVALPGGIQSMREGYGRIVEGNNRIFVAFGDINKGLSEMSERTAELPAQTQQLAKGQQAMKEGLEEAIREIEAMTDPDIRKGDIVSFAAPGKITPNSVQFVLRTPAIDREIRTVQIETEAKTPGFWERLLNLFQ